jgi:hypothetical protein
MRLERVRRSKAEDEAQRAAHPKGEARFLEYVSSRLLPGAHVSDARFGSSMSKDAFNDASVSLEVRLRQKVHTLQRTSRDMDRNAFRK